MQGKGCWSAIRRWRLWFALAGLLLVVSGCGGQAEPPPKHETHIRGIWHAALFYRQYNNYQWPRDAAELKQWAEATLTPQQVKDLGLVSLEETFVSPRDGEPYVVLPVTGSPPTVNPHGEGGPTAAGEGATEVAPTGPIARGPIFAHEARGVNGKRYVVYGSSFAEELTEEEFQRALAVGNK
jgi:hypothetical protein